MKRLKYKVAYPLFSVIKGFIQRLWVKYKVNKIVMLKNGIILVRFDSELGENEVVQGGIYHFDNKPFIVKAWSPNMEFTREEMHTVPIWVKFSGLNFKYWSAKGLSKIGSLVGKPLMVDHNTEQKIGLSFARLLVEVNMDIALPEVVMFRNEMGNVVEQKVAYDWKLTVCKFCNKYGDSKEVCRKKNPSNPVQNAKEKQGEKEQATMEKMWEARPFLTRGMVNCLAWNVRGLNAPNKQREVKLLCNKVRAGLICLLVTNLK
ncbi:uncharacterized protein [Nicotiana tomentosiformis]|uniref:uncharacterized protein n=1 Tax=Nicotiana tomentosiformis TaxID=4098 RepID=UPI00388C9365